MVLFGHGFLPMQGTAGVTVAQKEENTLGDILTMNTVAGGTAEAVDAVAPHYVCRVFCNLALVKCIVQYMV
jgi:hypothetical protein